MITKQKISRSTVKGLDKAWVLRLLGEADTKWFSTHSSQFNYHEHLGFIAEYVARNYHKEKKHGNQNRGHNR